MDFGRWMPKTTVKKGSYAVGLLEKSHARHMGPGHLCFVQPELTLKLWKSEREVQPNYNSHREKRRGKHKITLSRFSY